MNIINVCHVKCIASLLDKNLNSFKENSYRPQPLNSMLCLYGSMQLLHGFTWIELISSLLLIISYVNISPTLCDCLLEKSEYHEVEKLKWDDLFSR